MSALLSTIALAVRAGRGRLRLNQREFAAKTGLGAGTVGRVEAGTGGVSLEVLETTLEAVGLRLAVVDAEGRLWDAERDGVPADVQNSRDRLGRRLPPHLVHATHHDEMWWLSRQGRYPGRFPWGMLGYRLRGGPDL